MASPYVYIILIRYENHETITAFNSLSLAYNNVKDIMRLSKDDYLEDLEYIANEICDTARIAQGMLLPVAWNTDKSWTAFMTRTPVYNKSMISPPGGDVV